MHDELDLPQPIRAAMDALEHRAIELDEVGRQVFQLGDACAARGDAVIGEADMAVRQPGTQLREIAGRFHGALGKFQHKLPSLGERFEQLFEVLLTVRRFEIGRVEVQEQPHRPRQVMRVFGGRQTLQCASAPGQLAIERGDAAGGKTRIEHLVAEHIAGGEVDDRMEQVVDRAQRDDFLPGAELPDQLRIAGSSPPALAWPPEQSWA